MSEKTKIQWADSTINPVMACQGCELWGTTEQIIASIAESIGADKPALSGLLKGYTPSEVYHNRKQIAKKLSLRTSSQKMIEAAIAANFRCYAGILHLRHGRDSTKAEKKTNPGYASEFEVPKIFPGRMAIAAKWRDLRGSPRADKPWLSGHLRMIFISDMGDALSRTIPFDYLKSEIIDIVSSPQGQHHTWLWLTKQPRRMAEFSRWLLQQGVKWPDHLVAMTSVTSQKTVARVGQLKAVQCRYHGLSVEPLWSSVNLPLEGIDWVILGGESGPYAKPFDLAWARSIISQCRDSGCSPFVKQLGARPYEEGKLVDLNDGHGGDWEGWPMDLRVREIPSFKKTNEH